MKKVILTLFFVLFTITNFAESLDYKTATLDDYKKAYSEIKALTNVNQKIDKTFECKLFRIRFSDKEDVRAYVPVLDEELAKGDFFCYFAWTLNKSFPKYSNAVKQKFGYGKFYPKTIAFAEKHGFDVSLMEIAKYASMDELIELFSETLSAMNQQLFSIKFIDIYKKMIQNKAQKHVKRFIRSKGKSFVTKDGINPCEQYISNVTASLNAPYFSGLDEWLKSVGCKGIDLSMLPSKAEISKLKEDILYGEKSIENSHTKCMLYVCLGVDEYNSFVKEYNGEK